MASEIVALRSHPIEWVETIKPEFGHWFAGFVDGEGSFNITAQKNMGIYCGFHIALRLDDAGILYEIQDALGFGLFTLERRKSTQRPGTKPSLRFYVSGADDCLRLVQLFRHFPLRSKKARDFKIWADAVEYFAVNRTHGNKWAVSKAKIKRDERMLLLRNQLMEGRQFNE